MTNISASRSENYNPWEIKSSDTPDFVQNYLKFALARLVHLNSDGAVLEKIRKVGSVKKGQYSLHFRGRVSVQINFILDPFRTEYFRSFPGSEGSQSVLTVKHSDPTSKVKPSRKLLSVLAILFERYSNPEARLERLLKVIEEES